MSDDVTDSFMNSTIAAKPKTLNPKLPFFNRSVWRFSLCILAICNLDSFYWNIMDYELKKLKNADIISQVFLELDVFLYACAVTSADSFVSSTLATQIRTVIPTPIYIFKTELRGCLHFVSLKHKRMHSLLEMHLLIKHHLIKGCNPYRLLTPHQC